MTEPSESKIINRGSVPLHEGALVKHGDTVYRIKDVLDFESVMAVAVESGRRKTLLIQDLQPATLERPDLSAPHSDLSSISDDDWRVAAQRYEAIKPLLDLPTIGRQAAHDRAAETGVCFTTLYRWVKLYNAYNSPLALVPRKRGWTTGKARIAPTREKVIEEVIQDFYLTVQRSTPSQAIVEVQRLCHERGIKAPSAKAIRSRIERIPERERLRARGYKELAKNKFTPVPGKFPGADYPLAYVQIDHTPLDLIVVDDESRQPIGRPYVTVAIDMFSRVITGYYLSLDAPAVTSVAMCVAHSILPKQEWLELHGVDARWPIWGKPRTIHVDNGPEFKSHSFQRSCTTHGMTLEYRPVAQPRYGGGVERGLGTLLREIHNLPGTTFSNIKARDGYDSEKHAAMTLSEVEQYLVTWICKVYHNRVHSSLGMSPLTKWDIGIFGNAETEGRGIAPLPADRMGVLLDFLPEYQRTIQPNGVTVDNWRYYDSALRPWINATDPRGKVKRKFIFRRDPRDISALWFFDPTSCEYARIPFADVRFPKMSAWESDGIKASLKRQGFTEPSENEMFRGLKELREGVARSRDKTKKARRASQRQKIHEQAVNPGKPLAKPVTDESIEAQRPPAPTGLLSGVIKPYGSVE